MSELDPQRGEALADPGVPGDASGDVPAAEPSATWPRSVEDGGSRLDPAGSAGEPFASSQRPIEDGGPRLDPAGSAVEPSASSQRPIEDGGSGGDPAEFAVEPSAAWPRTVEDGGPRLDPAGSAGEPSAAWPRTVENGGPRVDPAGFAGEPSAASLEHGGSRVDPAGSAGEPSAAWPRSLEHGGSRVDPAGSAGEPSAAWPRSVEDGSSRLDPAGSAGEPSAAWPRSVEDGGPRLDPASSAEASAAWPRSVEHGGSRVDPAGSAREPSAAWPRTVEDGGPRLDPAGSGEPAAARRSREGRGGGAADAGAAGFDILGEAFFADPYPTLAAMRREAPCWHDRRLGAYVVTRYADVARVLKDDAFSSERVDQFGRGAPAELRGKLAACTEELDRWLLFRDPPAHAPLRRRVGRAFGANLRQAIARDAEAAVAAAIAGLRATAAPDLVRDLAYPVPTRVLASLLGIPQADIERFKRWTTDIFALIGAGVADATAIELGYRGVTELRAYVLELLRDRRAHPRADVLSTLCEPGGGVVDDDIAGMFMTIIVAGHETTTNLIANAVHAILADPAARAWVHLHGLPEDAVDELIRHDGSVFSLIRRARRDVTLAGQVVRAGECVFAMLNAGNRDPAQFPEPDRLDFTRARPAHLGLGLGLHACIGAAMARTIVSAAITALFGAWPDVALAPGHAWQRNMSIRGLVRLPVALAPATARQVAVRDAAPIADLAENAPRRAAAVHPADIAEVQAIVREAGAAGVALYPVSRGRNWGLGSRAPVVDGGVIVDLGRLRAIRALDLEAGVAVIEPGVSQGELADRLAGTPYLLNVTTSCRGTSVIGNALDRGQGALRLRQDELLGVEAVLGDGSLATTGVLVGARAGLFGRGSGPDATPLFCQSGFGVVTAAAIALVRRPAQTSYLYLAYEGAALPAVIDCVGRLRRDGVLDRIFYAGEMQLEPGRPGAPDFTLLGPLLGRARLVTEALALARAELAAIPGCKAVRTGDAEALAPGDPLYHRGRNFLGIPSCEPLRKRFGTTTCELDTASPTGWSVVQTLLPLDGAAVGDALAILRAAVDTWRLAASPHLSTVTPTAVNLMTMIWFPRGAEPIARMRGLRDELCARLTARGYPHSREAIDLLRDAARPRDPLLGPLKAAMDPRGVIAPGRYVAA